MLFHRLAACQDLPDMYICTVVSKSRGNRTPRTDLLGRVSFLTARLSDGTNHASAVRLCQERFGVSRSTAKRYIRQGLEDLRESAKTHLELETAKARLRLEEIYRLALEKNDLKAGIQAVTALCHLLGLYDQPKNAEKPWDTLTELMQQIRAGLFPEEVTLTVVDAPFGVTKDHKLSLETVTTAAAAA